MEIEDQQIFFPRVLFKNLPDYIGKRVTLIGKVAGEQRGILMIVVGSNSTRDIVLVEKQKKQDLSAKTVYVEVRGIVKTAGSIEIEELTELPGKEAFDFETYEKFVDLSLNKFKILFQED